MPTTTNIKKPQEKEPDEQDLLPEAASLLVNICVLCSLLICFDPQEQTYTIPITMRQGDRVFSEIRDALRTNKVCKSSDAVFIVNES